jgi:hypothetical protein
LFPFKQGVLRCFAGTVGAVYEALAPHAGVPQGEEPMELLLLVDLLAHRASKAFADPDQRLADIRERTMLLAYRYPSREAGPKSGNCEVHVVHRCATLWVQPAGTCGWHEGLVRETSFAEGSLSSGLSRTSVT